MNKLELSREVSRQTSLTQADAAKAVDSTLAAISTSLRNKEQVTLAGFGTFAAKTRAARDGRNPATGAAIRIPQKTSATFKPASVLRDL